MFPLFLGMVMYVHEVETKGKQKLTVTTFNTKKSWVHLKCSITLFFTNFKVIIRLVQEMEMAHLSLLLVFVVFGLQVLRSVCVLQGPFS